MSTGRVLQMQVKDTRSARKPRQARSLTSTQTIFTWLLLAFTTVLIISSLVQLALTFFSFEKHKKSREGMDNRSRMLETLEVIFLVIELIYYFYGLYNIYFQKHHSILCFGLSTMALTMVQLTFTIMLKGNPYQIVVHTIEIVYCIVVAIYGYLFIVNRIQPIVPHHHHLPPPPHPPKE